MASYRFVTEWRLHAPIEEVFAVVEDVAAWPSWWTMVKRVEPIREGDDNLVGMDRPP